MVSATRSSHKTLRAADNLAKEKRSPSFSSAAQAVTPTDTPPSGPPAQSSWSALDYQRHALSGAPGEDKILVRLCIDCSDADGVRAFDESLPVSLVRALINPEVANFFIPIEGAARPKPPRAKQHYLHSQYIREIILLADLPEEEQ